jgi:hypothetical protein
MAYAREVQVSGQPGDAPPAGAPEAGQRRPSGEQEAPDEGEGSPGAGPAQSSGRLWVPGS